MGEFSDFQKLELGLWVVITVFLLLFAYYFIQRGLKKEDVPKNFNIAAGIIFLGIGIMRILSIFHDYTDILGGNQIVLFIGNICVFLGTLPLVLYMEKNIYVKTKYFLSLASIILFFIFVFISFSSNFDKQIMGLWVIPPFGIELLILAGGYIYLIVKSSGKVRLSCIMILIGVSLIIGFWYLHGVLGPHGTLPNPALQDYFAILSLVFIIIGTMIAAKGFFGYT